MKAKIKLLMIVAFGLFSLIGCAKVDQTVNKERESEMTSEPVVFTEGTESGNTEVTFLGRASLKIKTAEGIVIYIDPFGGEMEDYAEPADLLLVTHQDYDHNKITLVTMKEDGVLLNCPKNIHEGDTQTVKDIKIEAVPAYNDNHSRQFGCGYILTFADTVLYHSGDTSLIDEMSGLSSRGIDYAFLCADGYYNMGPEEAMEVAETIKAKTVIPIHTAGTGLYDEANDLRFVLDNAQHMKPGDVLMIKPQQKK